MSVVDAKKDSADDICLGLEGCVRPKLFSGRVMEFMVVEDMEEHTDDGWDGAIVQG